MPGRVKTGPPGVGVGVGVGVGCGRFVGGGVCVGGGVVVGGCVHDVCVVSVGGGVQPVETCCGVGWGCVHDGLVVPVFVPDGPLGPVEL